MKPKQQIDLATVGEEAKKLIAEDNDASATLKDMRGAREQRKAQLKKLLPLIWSALEAGETVNDCATKEEWCKFAGCEMRTVQYILYGRKPKANTVRSSFLSRIAETKKALAEIKRQIDAPLKDGETRHGRDNALDKQVSAAVYPLFYEFLAAVAPAGSEISQGDSGNFYLREADRKAQRSAAAQKANATRKKTAAPAEPAAEILTGAETDIVEAAELVGVFARGSEDRRRTSVVFHTKNFVVFKIEGHSTSVYVGIRQYAKTQRILIRKGEQWSGAVKCTWEGRVSDAELKSALLQSEKDGEVAVKARKANRQTKVHHETDHGTLACHPSVVPKPAQLTDADWNKVTCKGCLTDRPRQTEEQKHTILAEKVARGERLTTPEMAEAVRLGIAEVGSGWSTPKAGDACESGTTEKQQAGCTSLTRQAQQVTLERLEDCPADEQITETTPNGYCAKLNRKPKGATQESQPWEIYLTIRGKSKFCARERSKQDAEARCWKLDRMAEEEKQNTLTTTNSDVAEAAAM